MSEVPDAVAVHRATIDAAYQKLYDYKHRLYAKIFAFGQTGQPENFQIDAELSSMRECFAGFNRRLIENADKDDDFMTAVWQKCFESGDEGMVFWFDAFVYTQKIQAGSDAPAVHVKMVLYPFQETAVIDLKHHIDIQKPMLVWKSRDMGASWMLMEVFQWFWLIDNNANFLVGSYKGELVDSAAPKALFPKFDYALEKLPDWMVPDGYFEGGKQFSKARIRKNPITKCVLEGEMTSRKFGRGGRNKAVGLDEFDHWEFQQEAKRSAGRNSMCLIYITTPNGPGKEAARMFRKKKIDVLTLHWTSHPEFQEGRYICQPGCPYHEAGGTPHSKKYDMIAKDIYNGDALSVRQEMDIDILGSGVNVFNPKAVQNAKDALLANPPALEFYSLSWEIPKNFREIPDDTDEYIRMKRDWRVKAEKTEGGPLRVYRKPFSCQNPDCKCKGTGQHTYYMGGDIAKGLPHGDADAAYMLDVTTGCIVAEWYSRLGARKLGEEWAKLCKWYGTSSGGYVNAWAAPEWNDTGWVAAQVMDLCGIMLHISRSEDKSKPKQVQYLGVVVHPANRNALIEKYLCPEINNHDADGLPRLFCPFIEFWDECEVFASIAATDHSKQNPDRAKRGAPLNEHDDRIFGMVHTLFGATERYGKIKGCVDEEYIAAAAAAMRRPKRLLVA